MRDPSAIEQYRKELEIQLEKRNMIKVSAMQQKSKIQWLGDENTSYSYAHMKNRVAQSIITRLMT